MPDSLVGCPFPCCVPFCGASGNAIGFFIIQFYKMTLYQIIGIILAVVVNYAGFRFAVIQHPEPAPEVPKKKEPEHISKMETTAQAPTSTPELITPYKAIARATPLEITSHSLPPNPSRSSGEGILEDYL